jgi:hypothetical protein
MKKIQILFRLSATILSAVLILVGCQKNENRATVLMPQEEEHLAVLSAES